MHKRFLTRLFWIGCAIGGIYFSTQQIIDNKTDGLGGGILARHFNQLRIIQEIGRKLFNLGRESRRKHKALTLGGQKLQDL